MKKSLDSKHLSGNHPDVVPESTRVAQIVIDVKFYVIFGVNSDIREIFIALFSILLIWLNSKDFHFLTSYVIHKK